MSLILNVSLPLHFAGVSAFPLDVRYLFVVGANILQLTVVQQWVVVLRFSQERMSMCTSFYSAIFCHRCTLLRGVAVSLLIFPSLWPDLEMEKQQQAEQQQHSGAGGSGARKGRWCSGSGASPWWMPHLQRCAPQPRTLATPVWLSGIYNLESYKIIQRQWRVQSPLCNQIISWRL